MPPRRQAEETKRRRALKLQTSSLTLIAAVQKDKKNLHHDDALADWRYLALVRHGLGRADSVLQSGAVRGQRVPAGVATVADPTTALHPVRFGLATRPDKGEEEGGVQGSPYSL